MVLPPIPPWLAPRYALTGIKLGLSGLLLLLAVVGCTTQTVRLEGMQLKLPLIGTIGPKGWKPYAQELEGEVRSIRIDLELSEAKHVATKRAYLEAQEEAARQQAEMIAREVARQERITDEVRNDYNRRIAALRARADRLRAEAGAGAEGAAGAVRVSTEGEAAGRANATARCDEFPSPSATIELNCREIAEAQAMQLDALISWVRQQLGGGGPD
jgi:hypothetical protein